MSKFIIVLVATALIFLSGCQREVNFKGTDVEYSTSTNIKGATHDKHFKGNDIEYSTNTQVEQKEENK